MLLFVGCKDDNPTSPPKEEEQTGLGPETAFPGQTGEITNITVGEIELTVEKFGEIYVYQGDIIIDPQDYENFDQNQEKKSKGIPFLLVRTWPDNTLPYVFDEGASEEFKNLVQEGIGMIAENTNVMIHERNDEHSYVIFEPIPADSEIGGSSKIGNFPVIGKQKIRVSMNAPVGTVAHEIMHALGLLHEQSRANRDEYIEIISENIKDRYEDNFDKDLTYRPNATYDYQSILHYGSYFFQKENLIPQTDYPTITKKDGSIFFANRNFITQNDIEKINDLYPDDENTIEPPVINSITANPNPSNVDETVNFSAEISGDHPIECEWDFGNGSESTECNSSFSFPNAGEFTISLTVTNDAGSDTETLTQEVNEASETNTIYVDADALGENNGTTWNDAYTYLQDALAEAKAGDEIWVAEGIYYPDEGVQQSEDDRSATFRLKDEVELYGGFNGNETSLSQRNWKDNTTTLSGDIGLQDDMADNSFHVVTSSNINNNSIIDGFTVTGGNADVHADERVGGGMLNIQSSPKISNNIFHSNRARGGGGIFNLNSNPLIKNSTFKNNSARYAFGGHGGGMMNNDSNPTVEECIFTNNTAQDLGGGIYNVNNSNPVISNSEFINNAADEGGGISNNENSNPLIQFSLFQSNIANYGAGIHNEESSNTLILNSKFIDNSADDEGGGIYISESNPKVVGSIFTGNTASEGGGGYFWKSEPSIVNSAFSKNSASFRGGGIQNTNSNSKIINSIFWGNSSSESNEQIDHFNSSSSISYSIIENGIQGDEDISDEGNNLSSNPLFEDAEGPDNIPGTLDDNLSLQSNSPAINAGLNSALDLDGDGDTTDDVPEDLEGNNRIQNGTVDIGAYEANGN